MRRLLIMLAAGAALTALAGMPAALAQDSLRLTGSGASFPFPIYSRVVQGVQRQGEGDHRRLSGARAAAPASRTSSTAPSTSPPAMRR